MRISQLHLIAFGPFTDLRLDLSGGQQGLHILYGPNEAGKSSSLRAITHWLFGFPSRTDDNFLHEYSKFRIGGTLVSKSGESLSYVRRKSPQRSLRDASDQNPIPDSDLSPFLGDVDKASFTTMFGIDHEQLRAGGEELVKGKGQIGEVLFASSTGLTALRSVRAELDSKVDAIFKSSGRAGQLVQTLKDLEQARQLRQEAMQSAEKWDKLSRELDLAKRNRDEYEKEIQNAQSKQSNWSRILRSIGIVAQLTAEQRKLEALKDYPLLPEDFREKAIKKLESQRALQVLRDTQSQRRIELTSQLESLPVDSQILTFRETIPKLASQSGATQKAKIDLPNRQNLVRSKEHEIRDALRSLGRSTEGWKIDDYRVMQSRRSRVQELGTQQLGLVAQLRATDTNIASIQLKIQRAAEKRSTLQSQPRNDALRMSLKDLRKASGLEDQIQSQLAELQKRETKLRAMLRELEPSIGDSNELATSVVPTLREVEQHELRYRQWETESQSLNKELRDLESQLEEGRHQLRTLEASRAIPTIHELTESRENRDSGWQLIKQNWKGTPVDTPSVQSFVNSLQETDLAQAFERSVVRADDLSDAIRDDADRVATKAKLLIDLERTENRIAKQRARSAELGTALTRWQSDWESLWSGAPFNPLPPAEMQAWLRNWAEIQRLVEELEELRSQLARKEEQRKGLYDGLQSQLSSIVPADIELPTTLASLIEFAIDLDEKQKKSERDLENVIQSLEQLQVELEQLQIQRAAQQREMDDWDTSWEVEMKRLELPGKASPAEAYGALDKVQIIVSTFDEIKDLKVRIDGMLSDIQAFEIELRQTAQLFLEDVETLDSVKVLADLNERLDRAQSNAEVQKRIHAELEKLNKDSLQTSQDFKVLELELDEMLRQSNQTSYTQLLDAAEFSSQKRIIASTIRTYEDNLRLDAGTDQLDQFIRSVRDAAEMQDRIQPEIDRCKADVDQYQRQRDQAIESFISTDVLLKQVISGDQAIEHAMQCESLVVTLEEQFRELLVLRLSAQALTSGIEKFREKNQDPVLLRASEHFQTMTLGAFSGLRVDWDPSGETMIVAVRKDGRLLEVQHMSDGTCDQVYLALRIASLEAWLDHHEPIPFIVDDILVHFDDERSKATLQVLAELSDKTQVIFFTHHQHLLELSRGAIPREKLFIHPLIPQ